MKKNMRELGGRWQVRGELGGQWQTRREEGSLKGYEDCSVAMRKRWRLKGDKEFGERVEGQWEFEREKRKSAHGRWRFFSPLPCLEMHTLFPFDKSYLEGTPIFSSEHRICVFFSWHFCLFILFSSYLVDSSQPLSWSRDYWIWHKHRCLGGFCIFPFLSFLGILFF